MVNHILLFPILKIDIAVDPLLKSEISDLLETYFANPRDTTSLMKGMKRILQLSSNSSLNFTTRFLTQLAKMVAAINKQTPTQKERQAQIDLSKTMIPHSLITGLEPKLGQII